MAVPRRIRQYLTFHDVPFKTIESRGTDPGRAALPACLRGRRVAKSLVIRTEDGYLMLVVPRDKSVAPEHLSRRLQMPYCRLAKASEIAQIFSDCEGGAVPALGNLYNLPVVLDKSLERDQDICIPAGSPDDLVMMRACDFAELTQAAVVEI